jgi:hypothetical protein
MSIFRLGFRCFNTPVPVVNQVQTLSSGPETFFADRSWADRMTSTRDTGAPFSMDIRISLQYFMYDSSA